MVASMLGLAPRSLTVQPGAGIAGGCSHILPGLWYAWEGSDRPLRRRAVAHRRPAGVRESQVPATPRGKADAGISSRTFCNLASHIRLVDTTNFNFSSCFAF